MSSVRIIKPFGAAIYTDIADQLKKRFPSILPTLQCNYGMTEMAVISISTSPKVLGSLLPGCEVKVLGKVIHPKYYKHLKKAAQHSHLGK